MSAAKLAYNKRKKQNKRQAEAQARSWQGGATGSGDKSLDPKPTGTTSRKRPRQPLRQLVGDDDANSDSDMEDSSDVSFQPRKIRRITERLFDPRTDEGDE